MRILLVEDDSDQLEPLQAALTHTGHVVDGVRRWHHRPLVDGRKGIRPVDFFDWMLPGGGWYFPLPVTIGQVGKAGSHFDADG